MAKVYKIRDDEVDSIKESLMKFVIEKKVLMKDSDVIAAIQALGEAGGEKAIAHLITLTSSTITNDKVTAIKALGRAARISE